MKLLSAIARGLANPARVLRRVLRLIPNLPTDVRVEFDLCDRPDYAYGLSRAAQQAKALGIPAISAIEFGVGDGAGLLVMESIAADIEASTGVQIGVFGFDTGKGLPEPQDFRDLPYLYERGSFPMDEGVLRQALTRAELFLGDVKDTVPSFLQNGDFAPVGFISFDLDYYSSTISALEIFDGDLQRYLPRVLCYFDDISNAEALQCDYTGEMRAIGEFNGEHEDVKIDRIRGLAASRPIPLAWNELMFACHFFKHDLYGRHVTLVSSR
jgi:hypothetical protein